MGDEFKSIRESLLRSVLSGLNNGNSTERSADEQGNARDLIVTLLSRAGKGKDEIVQILAREIGVAIAAMLRSPLSELAKHQKLQVTFEFVPKTSGERSRAKSDSSASAPKKSHPKKKAHRKKTLRKVK